MDHKKEIYRWLHHPLVKESDKEMLRKLIEEDEVTDYFYKELAFGTGGLRGIMQIGTSCMNEYTVAKASQGLATYLNKLTDSPSIAIAYDSRNNSRFFFGGSSFCFYCS